MLSSAHDAGDLLQEALLRAWRGSRASRAATRCAPGCTPWLPAPAWTSSNTAANEPCPLISVPSSHRAALDQTPGRRRLAGPLPDAGLAGSPASPYARYEQQEATEQAAVASRQRSRRTRTCTYADTSCAVPGSRTQGIVPDRIRRGSPQHPAGCQPCPRSASALSPSARMMAALGAEPQLRGSFWRGRQEPIT